jgi:hypothetical protein
MREKQAHSGESLGSGWHGAQVALYVQAVATATKRGGDRIEIQWTPKVKSWLHSHLELH